MSLKKSYVTIIPFFFSLCLAILCVQRFMGIPSKGKRLSVLMAVACVASWCTGAIFGAVPVAFDWIRWARVKMLRGALNICIYCILPPMFRYDPAEMLCAVFWESSYSDMLVYILCAFSISIFVPFLLILSCSILNCVGFGKDGSRFVKLEMANTEYIKHSYGVLQINTYELIYL